MALVHKLLDNLLQRTIVYTRTQLPRYCLKIDFSPTDLLGVPFVKPLWTLLTLGRAWTSVRFSLN